MPTVSELSSELDRLSQFDAGPYPVVSLYLNLQPNEHGRDDFDRFIRKEFDARLRTYPSNSPERGSIERDMEKIQAHLASVDGAANGLALFACAGVGLFDALTLAVPISEHRLVISHEPHVFPLARLLDEHATYAVLLADRHAACFSSGLRRGEAIVTYRAAFLTIALTVAAPAAASAQFTTFVAEPAAKVDSAKAAIVAETKAKSDSVTRVTLTDMKAWVDSAAGVTSSVQTDTSLAQTTTTPTPPLATASTTTFSNGAAAPDTASALPLITILGLASLSLGTDVSRTRQNSARTCIG